VAFVKFTETGKSFAPKASLNPRGYLSFNEGARKRYEIDKYDYVFLYYDHDDKKIGVELGIGGATEGALNLRKRQTGATVGAKAFVDYFDIPIKDTMIFDISQDDETGFLIIDLSSGKVRGAKKSKKESLDDLL
jgi:hypothetical protein